MKNYPLQISFTSDGYRVLSYYSKGHHDKNIFADAVKNFDETSINPDNIKYEYARIIPDIEYSFILEKSKIGKGAFPISIIEF